LHAHFIPLCLGRTRLAFLRSEAGCVLILTLGMISGPAEKWLFIPPTSLQQRMSFL
jgi:hypothetical protein